MISFSPNDPFPLIDLSRHSYTETLEHAEKVDAWLGLQVDQVEDFLAKHGCRSRARRPAGISPGISNEPQQLWIGLAPRSLLTPYVEIRSLLDRLNPRPGAMIVDLGAGFGRMGFVVARHFPLVNFIGYEYVGERVKEARRCFNEFSKKRDAPTPSVSFEHVDLSDAAFAPASAEYYFIYDFGSRKALEKSLHDLRRIATGRSISVIGRGRHSRDLIERGHPWLSGVGPVEHRGTNSIYTTVHGDTTSP